GESHNHHEFMAGPMGQILVNGPWAFMEARDNHDENPHADSWPAAGFEYKYNRVWMNESKFNACVISIEELEKVKITATWYDLQVNPAKSELRTLGVETIYLDQ